jgi:hypothetical protein
MKIFVALVAVTVLSSVAEPADADRATRGAASA